MAVRWDELPPKVQAQARTKLETQAKRRTRKAAPASETKLGGHCSCGEHFATFGAYERHRRAIDEDGHARYTLTLVP